MYLAKITRYTSISGNIEIELQIPSRVTITGKEDHFVRAVDDLNIALSAMRELDRATGAAVGDGNTEIIVRYHVNSLTAH